MSMTAELHGNVIFVTASLPGELIFLRQMNKAQNLDADRWRLPATPGVCTLLLEHRVTFSLAL
jgi:hypothetical protein